MILLVIGLVMFLGAHSVRIVADAFRARQIARLGEGPWKGLYTLVSLAGFALFCGGYGLARADPVVLYTPPPWTYHLTIALTVPAFVLIVAGNVPGNHFKTWLGHPMLAGTKLWALAHLLSNGTLADVLLFGGFLAWSIVAFANARRRDRRAGVAYPAGSVRGDAIVLVASVALWSAFAWWLHARLIGVDPMIWIGARI
jgi:uncharacterized membrane protein